MAKKYEDQMDIFEEGGLKDEGGSVDPVSGNDVPSGSTQKEVRDDIPAQLSEGEFVLPADVVRYIGLENIMKMRDMAKEGLQKMEDMGQMGNSEEATISDTTDFDDDIDKFIDELDQEEEEDDRQEFQVGGLAGMTPQTPGVQTPATGFLPPGVTAPGTDTTLPQAPVVTPGGSGPVPGMPTYETKQYIGPNGEIRSFTFINGEPVVPIPEGFKEYDPTTVPETQTGVPTAQVTGDGGGDGPEDQTVNVDPVVGTARALARLNPESKTAKAVDQYNSSMLKTGVSAAASVLSGNLPGLALSAYRGYKANKELKDTVGTTLAQNNPTLSAVLSETGSITSMSESDVANSIESGINMGMSPGLAAAITASGGKIQTGPAVTEVDINTGQQSTRQGQTSISGLAGNAETAVQEMYGQSLAQSNPTAYNDMIEEAAFYDATGYGVMSNVTSPVSSTPRGAPSTVQTSPAFDALVQQEAEARGLTQAPTASQFDTLGMTRSEMDALGIDPSVPATDFSITPSGAPVTSRGFSYSMEGYIDPVTGQAVPGLQASLGTPSVSQPSVQQTTARSIAETERQAQEVSSGNRDVGGSDFGSQGEADAVASDGWGSDAHFDAIDDQFDANESTSGGGGGDAGGGSYCCTKMVDHELWKTRREFALMHKWHREQPQWWRDGYDVWGNVIAETLLKKNSPFWTSVMQSFYDHHVKKKKHTLKSLLANAIIYPGVITFGYIAKITGRHVNAVQR